MSEAAKGVRQRYLPDTPMINSFGLSKTSTGWSITHVSFAAHHVVLYVPCSGLKAVC